MAGLETFMGGVPWSEKHNTHYLWQSHINNLLGAGWTGQQIAKFAPESGADITPKAQALINQWAGGAPHIGASGLLPLSTAMHYTSKGRDPLTIQQHGAGIANSPVTRGRHQWWGGFTPEAEEYLRDYWHQQQLPQEDPMMELMKMQMANIPTAAELMASMPEPKIRAGQDYATTGRSAQGMRIKKGTKFAEGGKRGTKGYFGRGAKFTGSTAPTMNIAGSSNVSPAQAANRIVNTA